MATDTRTGGGDQDSEGSELQLTDILAQLMARKWIIVATTLVGMLVGVFMGQLPPDRFRSQAVVHIERRQQAADLPVAVVGGGFSIPIFQRMETEEHIIQSRWILEPVVARLNLDWRVEPSRFPVIGYTVERRSVPFLPGWVMPQHIRVNESLTLSRLEVDDPMINRRATLVVTGPDTFRVSLPNREPIEGRVGEEVVLVPGFRLVVGAIEAARGREFTIWREASATAAARLRGGLAVRERGNSSIVDFFYSSGDRLRSAEIVNAVVRSYQEQTLSRRSAAIDQSISFIEAQLPDVRAQTAAAAEALAIFRRDRQTVELTMSSQELLARMSGIEAELEEIRFQEQELSQRLTSNHPDYRALLDRRARLEERLADIRTEAGSLPPLEQELLALTQRLERATEVESQLAERAEQLSIARASTVSNVYVLEDALGASRIGPNRQQPIMIGTGSGLLIGILLILGLNFMRRGIDDTRAIEELGLPLFATINKVKGLRDSDDQELYSIARTAPTDIVVESLRGLRTGLQFSLATAPQRSLMITSPAPAMGKSFVSLNLALVSAQSGARVLLIDADMRKGKLRKQFKLKRDHRGLSELLSGKATLDEVMVTDPEATLDFIPTGKYPPNPADLLTSAAFRNLLNEACEYYDLVLVDSPPVLAVADPGIIGQMTGMSLLVVKHLETTKAEIQSSQKILATSGVKLSGAILNQFDATASRYGHYGHKYGYYGGYKYGYD